MNKLHLIVLLGIISSSLALLAMEGPLFRRDINARITKKVVRTVGDPVVFVLNDTNTVRELTGKKENGNLDLPTTVASFAQFSSFVYLGDEKQALIDDLRNYLHTIVNDKFIYMDVSKNTERCKRYVDDLLKIMSDTVAIAKQYAGKKKQALPQVTDAVMQLITSLSTNVSEVLSEYSQRLVKSIEDLFKKAVEEHNNRESVFDDLQKSRHEKSKMLRPVPTGSRMEDTIQLALFTKRTQVKDKEVEGKELVFGQAQTNYQTVLKELKAALGEFGKKTVYLLNNRACKQKNMLGRLPLKPKNIVLDIFDFLESNDEFKALVHIADSKFISNESLYDAIMLTLQNYIAEAYCRETEYTAKGRSWEIAVALFLHDTLQGNPLHKLEQLNAHVIKSPENYSREIDAITTRLYVECKNCNIDNEEMVKKVEQQFLQQQAIASDHKHVFLAISKKKLANAIKEWLAKRAISYIDPDNAATNTLLRDAVKLYEKPYFIAD